MLQQRRSGFLKGCILALLSFLLISTAVSNGLSSEQTKLYLILGEKSFVALEVSRERTSNLSDFHICSRLPRGTKTPRESRRSMSPALSRRSCGRPRPMRRSTETAWVYQADTVIRISISQNTRSTATGASKSRNSPSRVARTRSWTVLCWTSWRTTRYPF